MTLVRALFSLIVWLICFAWMFFICVCCMPVALLVPFHHWQNGFPAATLGMVPRITCSRLKVTIDPRFDRNRVSVFVQNHVSMIDGLVTLASVPQAFCGVENEAHFAIPFYGWMMKLGGGIPVPKRPGGRLNGIIEHARERVTARNLSVLVLPEGGRTMDGNLKPFHRGGFFLARNLGLPIVPVAVRGLDRVLPKGTWFVHPGEIHVYIGPQIETAQLNDAEIAELTGETRRRLAAWVERAEMLPDGDAPTLGSLRSTRRDEKLAPNPALAIDVVRA
jgi:1-acyl-sn-glycerol-3-phosphate acyltransferase